MIPLGVRFFRDLVKRPSSREQAQTSGMIRSVPEGRAHSQMSSEQKEAYDCDPAPLLSFRRMTMNKPAVNATATIQWEYSGIA